MSDQAVHLGPLERPGPPPVDNPYAWRLLSADDVDELFRLHLEIVDALPDPQLYRRNYREFFARHISREGATIGVFWHSRLVGYALLRFPGFAEDNLAYDVNFAPDKFPQVVHLEECALHSSVRGHGLQGRLVAYRARMAANLGYRYAFTTVAPINIPSLKTHLRHGAEAVWLGKKYGSLDRFILYRDLRPVCRQPGDQPVELSLTNPAQITDRIRDGYRGYGITESGGSWSMLMHRHNGPLP
jgi:hypothetical protein